MEVAFLLITFPLESKVQILTAVWLASGVTVTITGEDVPAFNTPSPE
jgi:hypothetical protein